MFNKIFNDTEILIEFSIICGLTIIASLLFDRYLNHYLSGRTSTLNNDPTNFYFFKHLFKAIIYLIGFGWALLTLPITKTYGHSLLAGAGVTTLIAGFASQQALSNIVSGVFILIFKPFRINDLIEFQGKKGKVLEVNLHDTVLLDEFENKIIIPNSILSNGIITNFKNNIK
ncbi:mechanosensitive ion channel family protein [Flavobacterium sediminilitoris]|uniref:Mechanosensitive ion channel family protein n=1 Tax=Flavobacterium sediminilitoris TaxID=2024526 RepID=A0ABY4HL53_9FLAO|nr:MULTISPECIES: mechanosensitive ion channel domain-containing protein [Flavobacterium]UOX33566.1 mechanosensitive ion channel family protein [Flavobacterium sediminilitoris]